MFSVVVTTHFPQRHLLNRLLSCLHNQTYQDFEVIVVVDGKDPQVAYEPYQMVWPLHWDMQVSVNALTKSETYGNRSRHFGMKLAQGSHICWVGGDCLVFPDFLMNHYKNLEHVKDMVSIVNIDYWSDATYRNQLPTGFGMGQVDLLNFMVPTKTARAYDCFGEKTEKIYQADWCAFTDCSAAHPVAWDKEQAVCAVHF